MRGDRRSPRYAFIMPPIEDKQAAIWRVASTPVDGAPASPINIAPLPTGMQLVATGERVELRVVEHSGSGPLYVDFVNGPMGYARQRNRFGLLYRAIGLRDGETTVLDATAGLGADAFRLAYHGCRVTAIERSPILFALLSDGLERALRVPEIQQRLGDRLRLIQADARDVLRNLRDKPGELSAAAALLSPDTVYLDPMFPPKRKSALSKIEMRILREIVGDDPDSAELFELARAVARQRVVVKRHRLAPPLASNPSHSHCDKTTRYDVYLCPRA